MKLIALVLTLTTSFAALAFNNDVECMAVNSEGQRVDIEVERSFGGSLRDARTIAWGARGTPPVETRYRIYQVRSWSSRLEFIGSDGFRLEVDIFPDRAPRWGRSYWGHFAGLSGISCRFPNAQ